jgi:hypothetical protein
MHLNIEKGYRVRETMLLNMTKRYGGREAIHQLHLNLTEGYKVREKCTST